ncbi:MAG: bifunctional hydroxymethylpyrimidine kinase/phosphomethylpyrimidine kinase [Actinobacteria bacterium]|nr:bifunctional hydroxymethylpyrimidine kinase/phosphomethylpyrimidine kinase [Actinomycetota bacterium]
MEIKKALVIGGSDPSGGAGVQADMRTLVELGVHPYTVITAITAQNSSGVSSYEIMTARLVKSQIESVTSEEGVAGIKTGMLGSSENILEVARLISDHRIGYSIVDPVIKATDGKVLTSEASTAVLKKRLLARSFMVTPNISEATYLTGIEISTEDDLLEAAKALKEMGVAWVLIKGGHLAGDTAVDLLYDGQNEYYFEVKKVRDENVRGTGCMMASAICGYLIHGLEPYEAVDKAKAYVLNKIKSAVILGEGSRQASPFRIEGEDIENWVD